MLSTWMLRAPEPPVATTLLVSPFEWTIWTEPQLSLEGTLAVSDKGCVVIERAEGEVLLVTEKGSRLVDGGTRVEAAHIGTFTLGESIDLRGDISTIWRAGKRFTPTGWGECVEPGARTVQMAALARPR